MTTATLIEMTRQTNGAMLLVKFDDCSGFDSMMFKNNVFDWLFSNTLGHFELSADANNSFMVRLDENRDVSKFTKCFSDISFETTVKDI